MSILICEKTPNPYNCAFESGQLTYGKDNVDLYNSGINQILSVAASRGHNLYHFSADDLVEIQGLPYAKMKNLFLPGRKYHDYLHAHKDLVAGSESLVPLNDIHLYFLRADDIKPDTPNLDLLKAVERGSIFLENIDDTLTTCDKYEMVRRCPEIPQPVTYPADSLEEAVENIPRLPDYNGKFVLKDRFGYGCGAQVHLLDRNDPGLDKKLSRYINEYKNIIVQEFCPEVQDGDIVVTFFDRELLGTMRRVAKDGEWKTNASLGGQECAYTISPELENISRNVVDKFGGCRYSSVDMLPSGKVLEINAFPGGKGLLETYGFSVGNHIIDKLEQEAFIKFGPDHKRYVG